MLRRSKAFQNAYSLDNKINPTDIYNDSTWTHFGVGMENSKEIEWLKIDLTAENRKIVLDILRKIHVPGEVLDDCVYVYGYRTDVDYIK